MIIVVTSIKSCPQPTPPENGAVNGADFEVGATITYSCDQDYELNGDSTRICQESGGQVAWSGQAPTCESKNNR